MCKITLTLPCLPRKRSHGALFSINDDRRVVNGCVVLIKVSSYVGPVSVDRDIEY